MANKAEQNAGDNSTQIQAQNVYYGITEKRAREIFNEMYAVQARDMAMEASVVAVERVGRLEGKLIPRMEKMENSLESFKDPEFLYLLGFAEKTATQTDDEFDYEMLTQLLIQKINTKNSKLLGTGIKQAVQIVNELESETLLGLTLAYVLGFFTVRFSKLDDILSHLNHLFSKIVVGTLPRGIKWMDQLDVLKCARINDFSTNKPLEEYYYDVYEQSFAIGFPAHSEKHDKAIELLRNNGFNVNILVDSDMKENYLKLDIYNKADVERLSVSYNGTWIKINDQQKKALYEIFDLYDVVSDVEKKESIHKISDMIEKYDTLKKVRNWWNNMPKYLDLTIVGKVLAHCNAKIYEPELPSFAV